MRKIKVIDIAIIASLTAILFVQEQLLSFLPNIQLTIFLIVLYSKKLGLIRALLITIIHVLLDNLVVGSFALLYTPTMLISLSLIPILICTIFKKIEKTILLGLLGILFSLIYSWSFIIPNVIAYNMNPLAYFIADIPWEIILAASSFVSIWLLFNPCAKVIDIIYNDKKSSEI